MAPLRTWKASAAAPSTRFELTHNLGDAPRHPNLLASIPLRLICAVAGNRVTHRTVQRWRQGKHAPPDWILAELAAHARAELVKLAELTARIETAPPRAKHLPRRKLAHERLGPVEPAPLAE